MLIITGWSMSYNINDAWINKDLLLLTIGIIVIIFQFWIIYEGIYILIKNKNKVLKNTYEN